MRNDLRSKVEDEEFKQKKQSLLDELSVGYNGKNLGGGFISLFFAALMGYYLFWRIYILYTTNAHVFNFQEIFYTLDQMDQQDITLENYDNSMNFIFGLSGGDMGLDTFDILNNPYIEYHGLERKGGRTFYPNYELEVCSKDHLALFLKDN